MIRQKVHPFKVEKTEDTITAHGSLAFFVEFVIGLVLGISLTGISIFLCGLSGSV